MQKHKKALPWSPPVLSHVPLPACALQPCRLTILPSPLPRSTNWPERPLRPASTFLTCWLVAGTYGRHTCQYIFRVKEAPYQKLSHTDWNTFLAANNIDSNCDLFLDKLYMYYSSFPKMTKTLTSKRLQKPFRVSLTIRFKFYLYKQYKLSNIPFDNYKEYRNHLNISIKEVESIFFQQKFTNFRNKIKKVEKSSKK